jgi:hypothetical protein
LDKILYVRISQPVKLDAVLYGRRARSSGKILLAGSSEAGDHPELEIKDDLLYYCQSGFDL